MPEHRTRLRAVLGEPLPFVKRVVAGFRANQGFLLSGAVAYYTLLSIVPMFTLILVGLSQFIDREPLLETASATLGLIAPAQSGAIVAQISVFLDNWRVVGLVGLGILLFFSSLAFTVLENAMSVIFFHRVAIRRRHFLVSAILPYCYILLLAFGLFVVSAGSSMLHALDDVQLTILGRTQSLAGASAAAVYLFGVIGEVLLLTSLYMVMPVGQLALRHALIGGVTATFLWEIMRHLLVWYFTTLSLVNVIYGSLATAVVILLSVEVAALILLFGAQVIAEYERVDAGTGALHGLQT
jgi:YihY family inner membrane protein